MHQVAGLKTGVVQRVGERHILLKFGQRASGFCIGPQD